MSGEFKTISPEQLQIARNQGQYVPILDVRSVAEYRAGHIPGAASVPIEELAADVISKAFEQPSVGQADTLYLTCQAGPRARQAAERLHELGFANLTLIEGGTQQWQQLGLPLERCSQSISLERQVQIAIGGLLLLKVFLGFSVHELFFALTAVIGTGLIIAGTTRWCGMARLVALLPWNRNTDCTRSVSA